MRVNDAIIKVNALTKVVTNRLNGKFLVGGGWLDQIGNNRL